MTEKEIDNAGVSDDVKAILRSHNLTTVDEHEDADRYIYFGLVALVLLVSMALLAFILSALFL